MEAAAEEGELESHIRMRILFKFAARAVLTAFLGSCTALAQATAPTDVPGAVAVPEGLQLVLFAHAKGSQIYICQGGEGKFDWTLKAPEAELFDGRDPDKMIGHHGAGPSWMLDDGSKVTGKAVARADSPDVNSIPWLLVSVVSNDRQGLLGKVTTIQRLNTHGGKAPSDGCDDSRKGAETRSSYTADYYFYAPK